LICFIAVIWIAVGAFRRGRIGWGLGILFGPLIPLALYLGYFMVVGPSKYHLYIIPAIGLVTPATIIYYALNFWSDVKKPFIVYMTTFVLSVGLGLYVFTAAGGMAMLKASQDVARGITEGNLTEADALNFMNKNLDMIETTDLSPEQQKKMEFMREFLRKAEGGFTEQEQGEVQSDFRRMQNPSDTSQAAPKAPNTVLAKKEKPEPTKVPVKQTPIARTSEPAPTSPPPPSVSSETVPVHENTLIVIAQDGANNGSVGSDQLAQIKGWHRKFVRVTPKNGVPQRGVLVDVSNHGLRLEKDMSAGFVTLPFNYDEIESIELVK
ncbi:MAG: hypothetical protein GTO40_07490, partial [Deltaproteobacteria bacterium]|nr:hypothetical protein [Deltaproteobacteria bacterium]